MPLAPPEEGAADLDALPKLSELVLAHTNSLYLCAFAHLALASLTLDLKDAHFLSPPSLLANLTSLQVTAMQASEADVRGAYWQMQALTSLELNASILCPYWVDLLFPQESAEDSSSGSQQPGELLLPRLETLATKWVVVGQLYRLVKAREERGVPLRSILMSESWRETVCTRGDEWLGQYLERLAHFRSRDQMDEVDWDEEYYGQ